MQKPVIPKGTRDFTPEEMSKRNYIFDTIKSVFQLYGFQQIETPAMENLSTLMGKYGDEGDKLLFKIINSGDFLAKANETHLQNKDSVKLLSSISEKGLRYDLTVPFARFVVQHQSEISFPFKRYQIQPVWRADRPQKGRYREFYQCDADIVGSDSLINEADLVQIIDEVFHRFGIRVTLKVNNRKILAGIAEVVNEKKNLTTITVAIDKLDKIGLENVNLELKENGLSEKAIEQLQPILLLEGSTEEKLSKLKEILKSSEIGLKGIEELEMLFDLTNTLGTRMDVELDLKLARGLNYYTGAIFEVKAKDVEMGSISGGGRYDNLTGIFGLDGVSGVGISFGADRIYDVLNQLKLYPEGTNGQTKILFVTFGEKEMRFALSLTKTLRKKGFSTEIYPDTTKMKKQMSYANNKGIPFVAIVGETEVEQNKVMLKNMGTGEQNLVSLEELINSIS